VSRDQVNNNRACIGTLVSRESLYHCGMRQALILWPFAALAIALVMLVWLCVFPRPQSAQPWSRRVYDIGWLFWLGVPLYMLHQFEEHGVDLLGRRYHFQVFMCDTLGFADLASCPADQAFIFAVNVGAVWIGALIGATLGPVRPIIGATAYAVPLVNGFAHIVPALAQGAYNPGLATGAALFVPVSLWVMSILLRQRRVTLGEIALAIVAGLALHAIMLVSLLARARGTIGELILLLIQVALGFMPLLVDAIARWRPLRVRR
jgi:hypothetical protein